MWGQGKLTSRKLWLARIIPTRVGTRASELNYYFTHRDHPHACGDKVWKNGAKHQFKGSSPRVWGQEVRTDNGDDRGRIIPTRVGTSDYVV